MNIIALLKVFWKMSCYCVVGEKAEKNRNGSTWPSFGGQSQCFT
jgi:hypothetical protein